MSARVPNVDALVLGVGLAVLVFALGVGAVIVAARSTSQRMRCAGASNLPHPSSVALVASSAGAPISAVTGIRFALDDAVGSSRLTYSKDAAVTAVSVIAVAARGCSRNPMLDKSCQKISFTLVPILPLLLMQAP